MLLWLNCAHLPPKYVDALTLNTPEFNLIGEYGLYRGDPVKAISVGWVLI